VNDKIFISDTMISEIKQILIEARTHVAREVNSALLQSYWEIGRVIVEHEQNNNERAVYGKSTLIELSMNFFYVKSAGHKISYLEYEKYQTGNIGKNLIRYSFFNQKIAPVSRSY